MTRPTDHRNVVPPTRAQVSRTFALYGALFAVAGAAAIVGAVYVPTDASTAFITVGGIVSGMGTVVSALSTVGYVRHRRSAVGVDPEQNRAQGIGAVAAAAAVIEVRPAASSPAVGGAGVAAAAVPPPAAAGAGNRGASAPPRIGDAPIPADTLASVGRMIRQMPATEMTAVVTAITNQQDSDVANNPLVAIAGEEAAKTRAAALIEDAGDGLPGAVPDTTVGGAIVASRRGAGGQRMG